MDRSDFQRWLDDYAAAWQAYDPDKIAALFADDVEYRYRPMDEPVVGRDAVVADWLEDRDEPGTYEGSYEPLAIDGDIHVARGVSRYYDGEGGLRDEYSNIFVCRFDGEGRCSSYTEYWTQTREFEDQAQAQG